MSKFGSWGSAITSVLGDADAYIHKGTAQTYRNLREQYGLETVLWDSFEMKSEEEKRENLQRTREFLGKNKPCLFIYDPVSSGNGLKKGFLFGISRFEDVEEWVAANKEQVSKYVYLITTQITNPGDGFVGSCFCDGQGNMFGETLHRPGISNQRELSQPKEDISKYLERFSTSEFALLTTTGRFLTPSNIEKLMGIYGDKKGYFEFVYGMQAGKKGVYTVGYDEGSFFRFPREIWLQEFFKMNERLRARMLSEQ